MTVQISAAQRDALYRRALAQLRAFDDLLRAIDSGEAETAYRIGRRMTDALRLIQEELGWAWQTSGDHDLGRMSPRDLLGILDRIRSDSILEYESQLPELEEVRGPVEEAALIRDTCGEVMDNLRREARASE